MKNSKRDLKRRVEALEAMVEAMRPDAAVLRIEPVVIDCDERELAAMLTRAAS